MLPHYYDCLANIALFFFAPLSLFHLKLVGAVLWTVFERFDGWMRIEDSFEIGKMGKPSKLYCPVLIWLHLCRNRARLLRFWAHFGLGLPGATDIPRDKHIIEWCDNGGSY